MFLVRDDLWQIISVAIILFKPSKWQLFHIYIYIGNFIVDIMLFFNIHQQLHCVDVNKKDWYNVQFCSWTNLLIINIGYNLHVIKNSLGQYWFFSYYNKKITSIIYKVFQERRCSIHKVLIFAFITNVITT